MPTQLEVERLTQVYRRYRMSGAARSRWSDTNPGNQAIAMERTCVLEQILDEAALLPLTDRRILDVGCGAGNVLAGYRRWGASASNLYGVDLLAERVEAARHAFPEISFQQGNAERLAFPDASFDLVLLYTVFTSILDPCMAQGVAQEVRRVLKPGGSVVWYDFRYNNPANAHVRGIGQATIRALFPDYELRLRRVTLLPPLARRFGAMTPILYPALSAMPLLRTHYLGLLSKSL